MVRIPTMSVHWRFTKDCGDYYKIFSLCEWDCGKMTLVCYNDGNEVRKEYVLTSAEIAKYDDLIKGKNGNTLSDNYLGELIKEHLDIGFNDKWSED